MRKTAKRLVCFLLALGCLAAAAACGGGKETGKMKEEKKIDEAALGLMADGNGVIYLAGKPFYAYGVNSFTMATRYLDEVSTPTYEEQFALLKQYGIPVVRINFGGYWPEYYERFDRDPDTLIGRMRDVVACAEKNQIGLICSLLWYDGAISFHVGEKRSAMGDPESRTVSYTKDYVARIVREFKDSPAVWAWEIGNEYNLDADLADPNLEQFLPNGPATPESPSGFDYFTSEEMQTYYRIVAETIRQYDPNRLISSGNGDMRQASAALHRAAAAMDPKTHLWTPDWTEDTQEDFCEMCEYFTPDPIDTVCFHLQHGRQSEAGIASYLLYYSRFGTALSTEEYLEAYAAAAKKAGKALYFGEMGDFLWMEDDERTPKVFAEILESCKTAGIQLATSWQFAANDLVATDEGVDGEKLKALQQVNETFQREGKQNAALYWEKHAGAE